MFSDPSAVAQYIEALVVTDPTKGANYIQQGKYGLVSYVVYLIMW